MSNGRVIAAIVSLSLAATLSAQAPLPDFSGTWRIDDAGSGRGVDVWGQTRARVMQISQSASELTLVTEGGGLTVPGDRYRYRLDGVELIVRDDSLADELPNFIRKVRTLAQWDGVELKTEVETVSESVDPDTSAPRVGRGITSVLTFRLGPGGNELIVERTGFRAWPPVLLHGQPYDRRADLAYNLDRVRYVRATTR
jgi:hypothetical protein